MDGHDEREVVLGTPAVEQLHQRHCFLLVVGINRCNFVKRIDDENIWSHLLNDPLYL